MTHKETERLITKFLNGETTIEEEKQLTLEAMCDDAPQEWKIIARMIGELTTDEALFDQIMTERTTHKFIRKPKYYWWLAAAASLLLLIGFATSFMFITSRQDDASWIAEAPSTPITTDANPVIKPASEVYIGNTSTSTVTLGSESYQDPARVSHFIEQLARIYHADSLHLDCSGTPNSLASVYVFVDKKENDIIGKLLQVACWYDNSLPGYRLNLTNEQFLFELKDSRKNMNYLWMAERVGGRILLHCSHTTANTPTISPSYNDFRNNLGNNLYLLNKNKTRKI